MNLGLENELKKKGLWTCGQVYLKGLFTTLPATIITMLFNQVIRHYFLLNIFNAINCCMKNLQKSALKSIACRTKINIFYANFSVYLHYHQSYPSNRLPTYKIEQNIETAILSYVTFIIF